MKNKVHICCLCAGDICPVHAYSLVGDSVSGRRQGPDWLTLALLMESLPFLGPPVLPPAFYKTSRVLSKVWLWVSISVLVNCWVDLLRGQLC